jgi:hypothetical protein
LLIVFALRAALLQLFHHALQVRIPGAKASCDEVSATFGDQFAIRENRKLARLSRRDNGVNTQPLFDEVCETRDLGLVVLSSRAGTYLNLHSVLPLQCLNVIVKQLIPFQ